MKWHRAQWTDCWAQHHITVCLPNLHHWPFSRLRGNTNEQWWTEGGQREDRGRMEGKGGTERTDRYHLYLDGNFRAFQLQLVSEMVAGQRRRHAVFRAFRWSPSYLGRTTYIILHSHIFTHSQPHSHNFSHPKSKIVVSCLCCQWHSHKDAKKGNLHQM